MTRDQAKDYVKGQLEPYLQSKGINTRKPFHCLNPEHADNNPSMSYDAKRQRAHCFACGVDWDTFALIAAEYGITDDAAMFEKAYEVFGVDNYKAEPTRTAAGAASIKKADSSIIDYLAACQARIAQTNYPQTRGLTEEVIQRFGLGYDPHYKAAGGEWRALIIPTGPDTYLARNTDPDADKQSRYRKQGGSPVFNREALWEDSASPVFLVEGEIDALSIYSAGGEAVALGSTANAGAFLRLCESKPPSRPLIIALDNDAEGEKTAETLSEALQTLRIASWRVSLYGECKDANEALLADREAFTALVEGAERIEEEAKAAEREAYLQNSAAAHIKGFVSGIAASIDTPGTPTGFAGLDAALDGGLYEGLYIMGAISSLGKTTFALQMADQIAANGRDVLIFSLEMARYELMSKSISRETLLLSDATRAKTARGITTGKRYLNYTADERALIQNAMNAYEAYAGNIYISEGIGEIGAEQIRHTVKRHIEVTGRAPVVAVDYLQILAPHNERGTDKQNTDRAVLELKRISRDYKIPVLCVSSFNRENYKNAVTMESFKESGAVEYSSDVLIGLQLQGVGESSFNVDDAKRRNPREVELVILKNRNGATGLRVAYQYYPLFNYFREG